MAEDETPAAQPRAPPSDFVPLTLAVDSSGAVTVEDARRHMRAESYLRPRYCGNRLSERGCLILSVGLLALLSLLLLGGLGSALNKKQPAGASTAEGQAATGLCLTPPCIRLSANLLDSLNTSVDPDFFEYSCGQWLHRNPIPDDKTTWGTFAALADHNQHLLRRLLERPVAPADATSAHALYQSCMNLDVINARGREPLLPLLRIIDWGPADNDIWDEHDKRQLAHALAVMNRYAVYPFYQMWVAPDDGNSSVNVLHVSQAGLGLPDPSYYENGTIQGWNVEHYVTHISRALTVLNDGTSYDATVPTRILELETVLARHFLPKADLRDQKKTYNKHVVKDLPSIAPSIDWTEYLATLFPGTPPEVLSSTVVIVQTPSYLSGMSTILTGANKRTVIAYLQWRMFSAFMSHLSGPFIDETFQFSKVLHGVRALPDRWKTCVQRTDDGLGFVVGKLFADEHFQGDSKKVASEMIDGVRNAFKEGLPALGWMDEQTRQLAREKADSITVKIGYPDFFDEPGGVEKYYEKLEPLAANTYFENVIALRKWEVQRRLDDLFKPVDRSPPTVNAYYHPSYNEIAFPAGILQPPFYEAGYPEAYNYGGIGVVMGHEVTHGFDDSGSQFDRHGDYKPWWPEAARAAFMEQARCIAEQYSRYSIAGEYINGNLTLGENIADNGGIKEAFRAYKARQKQQGGDNRTAGLSLTSDQLFFVGFAQVWCGATRPETERARLRTNTHSPGKFRIIGTVSNSREFAEAFKCPEGSPMNPPEKCEVW